VSEIANQLSTDIGALQGLLAAAQAERDAAIAERDQALSQMDRLRHLLRRAVLALPEIDEEAGAETGA
jgi:transposase